MAKDWICDPNEKFETLTSAFFQLDDVVKEIENIRDAEEIADGIRAIMDILTESIETAKTECEADYQEMIRDLTADYWRAVI